MAAKNLETTIAAWEADVRSYQNATGEKFPEANRKLLLINMCPEKLRESLRAMERSRVSSYELIKREIVDWLMDEARKGKSGGRAAALGEKDAKGIDEEEAEEVDWDNLGDMSHVQLMALVKKHEEQESEGQGQRQRQERSKDMLRVRRRGAYSIRLQRAQRKNRCRRSRALAT